VALWMALLVVAVGCGKGDSPPPEAELGNVPLDTADATAPPVKAPETAPLEVVVSEATPPSAESIEPGLPEVVATVDGQSIPGGELQKAIEHVQRSRRGRGGMGPLSQEEERALLERLIDGKVLLILAEQAGQSVTDEEVDEAVAEQKAQLPSEEVFTMYLDDAGLTEEAYRGQIRENLGRRKYIEEATKDIEVSDEELAKEYEALKAEGSLDRPEETVDVSHVLVEVAKDADEEVWSAAKEEIDAARARIVAGEEFGKVAKEVSDDPGSASRGGSYPETPRNRMVQEFEERMFTLPVGEVSEPFRTQFGWHILTVTAKHEPGTMTMEETSEPLAKFVLSKKRDAAVSALIAEAKKGMDIQVLYPEETGDEQPADAADPGAEPLSPAEEAPE